MKQTEITTALSTEILCSAGDIVIEKGRFSVEMLHRSDLHLPYPEADEVGRQLRIFGLAGPDGTAGAGAFDVAVDAKAWAGIRTGILASGSPAARSSDPAVPSCTAPAPAHRPEVPASPPPVSPAAVESTSVEPHGGRITSVPVDSIDIDDQFQLRAKVDPEVIEDYAELMGHDEKFPAILLMASGNRYVLVDGRHRLEAARKIGLKMISAEFTSAQGSMAVATALQANARHGRCLTPSEKKAAVAKLLADPELKNRSNEELGKLTGLSATFVGKCRRNSAPCGDAQRVATRNGKQYKINTSRIGKRKSKKTPSSITSTAPTVTQEPPHHDIPSRMATLAREEPVRDPLTIFDDVIAQLHNLELALEATPADRRLEMSDRAAKVLSGASAVLKLCKRSAVTSRKAA